MSVTRLFALGLFSVACTEVDAPSGSEPVAAAVASADAPVDAAPRAESESACNGALLSPLAAHEVWELTQTGPDETVYTTYERIDGIASAFETCGDPWGLFATVYKHITLRSIDAIEAGTFADPAWAERLVVDFAERYFVNLRLALEEKEPSWAWAHHYSLADRDDVSGTRALVVAMVAHLTLDLPHCLVAIGTTEDHKDDFFVFGEKMVAGMGDFLPDLRQHYGVDAEDLLNGFFLGDWVDGLYGRDAAVTLSFQTIRTKSWNNRWLLEQDWGVWVADTEIWTAFWAIDGVLATLDAAGVI